MAQDSWMHSCLSALRGRLRVPVYREDEVDSAIDMPLALEDMKQAMRGVVGPCSLEHRARALHKIALAGSPMDLWLLRPDVYQYLAQDLGQAEAAKRMAALVPLFEAWAPGSVAHPVARAAARVEAP